MRTRRGQGMSLNVIIIAAIALVVMVILIALVLNTGGEVNRGVNSCEKLGEMNKDWQCIDSDLGCQDGWIRHPTRGCPNSDPDSGYVEYCCIPMS